VLDFWAVPLVRLLPAAEPFLAHRDSFSEQGQTWPELHALAGDARKYLRRTGREAEATRALPSDPSVEVI
jgi:hypothetical protein